MEGIVLKKSHSWWWDSHISPKSSKWMAENVEEMDRCVKEMLKMIEEDGDSFAKKAELYFEKRPELISHVEAFYRMYCALAERYDHVTGELRKNIPLHLQSQGSADGLDVGSEPPSPTQSPQQTPDLKLSLPKLKARAARFDFFLGSGGSSDSRKESDVSSSSDSGSDSYGDEVQEMNGYLDAVHMSQRVVELESEINDMKKKLQQHEDQTSVDPSRCIESKDHEGLFSRVKELETKLAAANEKLQAAQEVIEQLQHHLERSVQIEAELNLEKALKSKLENQIIAQEASMSDYKHEIEQLNATHSATVEKFRSEVADLDQAIQSFEIEIAALHERFSLEKFSLEAEIADREHSILDLKASIDKFTNERLLLESKVTDQECAIEKLNVMMEDSSKSSSEEKMQLESEIVSLSESHASLKVKLALLEDETRQLEVEKAELCAANVKRVEELNQNLDSLKLKHDILTSERDELSAKVSTLINEVECRDAHIREMDTHLQHLHVEHVKLIMEIENAERLRSEMNENVKDLEEEVERQKAMISDGAEKKREAIRQLCFSLEHYRDGYNQLRQRLLDHRRLPIMLTS